MAEDHAAPEETGNRCRYDREECLAVISDVDVEDCENVFPLDDVGNSGFLLQYM